MSIRTCLKLMMTITCVVPICAQQDDSTRGNENRAILQLIEGASPNENLAVLQAALDSIAYRLEDPEGYARIVSGAFNSLYAKGTHDVLAARRVEQRYALFALDRPDLLPADMELYVAMRLRANISSIGEYDEEELRRKLDILFHAWRRMEREIIANFDFSPANFPEENVWPPADAIGHTSVGGIYGGMDPALITDEGARNKYLAAIEANRKKGGVFNLQVAFKNTKPAFIRHVESFLLAALKIGAVTEGDVISQLTLVKDDAGRERVISKVRSRGVR